MERRFSSWKVRGGRITSSVRQLTSICFVGLPVVAAVAAVGSPPY